MEDLTDKGAPKRADGGLAFTVEKVTAGTMKLRPAIKAAQKKAKKKRPPKAQTADNSRHVRTVIEFEESPVAWKNRAVNAAQMAEYARVATCPRTSEMLQHIQLVIEKWTALKTIIENEMQQ